MNLQPLVRWALCYATATATPATMAYMVNQDQPWTPLAVATTVAITGSWGAWSSLFCVRKPSLRALSLTFAGLWPLLVMPILGALFALHHRTLLELATLLLTTLGATLAAFLMASQAPHACPDGRAAPRLLIGFPLLTTALAWALLIASVELSSALTHPTQRVLVACMALALLTTTLPAATARLLARAPIS